MRMGCERMGLCNEPTAQREGPQCNREHGQMGGLRAGRKNIWVRSPGGWRRNSGPKAGQNIGSWTWEEGFPVEGRGELLGWVGWRAEAR